jgi:hypothetical protein
MKKTKLILVLAVVFAATLVVGTGSAAAHGGPGYGHASTSALVNAGAKQLGISSTKLKTAIVDSAIARINEAVTDGDLESEYAADLKDEARDNLRVAYVLSRTSTVASNLGVTTAQLNTAFRTARKALILKRIDEALADGDITADQAATLKTKLDQITLPGYKAFGLGYGGGRGHHR